jgi:hypothetical protein
LNAVAKYVQGFVLIKYKNDIPITREAVQMKALEIAVSLKILHQDFKTINGWTVRYVCHKGLAGFWRNISTITFYTW